MGSWEEIVDYVVPSNTTSVDFTGLNITKDDFIKVHMSLINNLGNSVDYNFFPNNDTTSSNYHRQFLAADSGNVIASKNNSNRGGFSFGGQTDSEFAYIKLSENNVFNMFNNRNGGDFSGLVNSFEYMTSSGITFPSGITSLTLNASSTNGLGANSRIQIYRLTAEKVADVFAPAGNNLQVDITGLSIDKGSEYLLVGYLDNQQADGSTLGLFYNNETNNADYYFQRIQGNGTSSAALRYNFPAITTTPSFEKSEFYTHIKLSNIGAFTTQSYSVGNMGTSNVIIYNDFTSSVAENINQITTLNIKSVSSTRAIIGGGSRFELYKLY